MLRIAQDTSATQMASNVRRTLMRNGLHVVCRQSSHPTTAVGLTFHAGSRHEPQGGYGLAHLAEHALTECRSSRGLLFREECAEYGLIGDNTATDFDFTWVFAEAAPVAAPGLAALLSEIADPQARTMARRDIEVQRKVILSELDHLENAGWAHGHRRLLSLLFGNAHPYGHPICGTRDDIVALNSYEVEIWSEHYFRPENAVLVVCGPHDPDIVLHQLEQGIDHSCRRHPVPPAAGNDVPNLPDAPRSEIIWAERSTAVLRRAWVIPRLESRLGPIFLKVFVDSVLAAITQRIGSGICGQIARHYKNHALCGLAEIQVTDLPPDHVSLLQDVMDSTLVDLADVDRCADLLNRSRTTVNMASARRDPFELIKALTFETFHLQSPFPYSTSALSVQDITAQELAEFVQRRISRRFAEIVLRPPPPISKPSASRVPRARLMPPPARMLISWPKIASNKRPSQPDLVIVQRTAGDGSACIACFRAGASAHVDSWRGLSRLVLESALHRPLDTAGRTAPQLAATFGARISVGMDLDLSVIQIDSPGARTEDAIRLLKSVCCILCEVPDTVTLQSTVQKLRNLAVRERRLPDARILQVLPTFLFEEGHPYCCSWTGLEPKEYPKEISRQMVSQFARRFFHPHNAVFIVVSPLDKNRVADLATITDVLPQGVPSSEGTIAVPQYAGKPELGQPPHLYTDSTSQTVILGAAVLESGIPGLNRFNIDILRHVLGAPQSGRFNNLLRTLLGHTYGVQTRVHTVKGPQAFLTGFSVVPSMARPCMEILLNELAEIRRRPDLLAAEIEREKTRNKRMLINNFTKPENIISMLLHCVSFGRDYNDVLTFLDGVDSVSVDGIANVLDRFFKPDNIVWMTAGADPKDG